MHCALCKQKAVASVVMGLVNNLVSYLKIDGPYGSWVTKCDAVAQHCCNGYTLITGA